MIVMAVDLLQRDFDQLILAGDDNSLDCERRWVKDVPDGVEDSLPFKQSASAGLFLHGHF